MVIDAGDALRRRVRDHLAAFPRRAAEPPVDYRRAAVAVALLDVDRDPSVLLLKRASGGRNAMQWAFPGGRLEPGEDAVDAALREAFEEVALTGTAVVGLLDDFVTDSRFVITPVVVIAGDRASLRRNAGEVHSMHPVRIDRLLADDLPRWQPLRGGGRLLQMPIRHDMVVHAPTGAILWQFREVALLGRHTRVADVAQPEFTRR